MNKEQIVDWTLGIAAPAIVGGIITGLVIYFMQSSLCAQVDKADWVFPLVTAIIGTVVFGFIGYRYVIPMIQKGRLKKMMQE